MDSLQILQNYKSLEVLQLYQKVVKTPWHVIDLHFRHGSVVCMISLEEKMYWLLPISFYISLNSSTGWLRFWASYSI